MTNSITLITHGHLLTMQGDGVGYIRDGAIAIQGARIAAIGSTAELVARYPQAERLEARVVADPLHEGLALLEAMRRGWL